MHRIRLALPLLVVALLLTASAAQASPSDVVVSQVFAGGGNTGAPFSNDFVELLDRSSSPVDLGGWTVQYASAASTSWQATPLAGTIQPGHHYLVQLASTAAVGAPLPAPDATGTTNLAASGGKVALVRDATALTCGATAGSCSAAAGVADLVGYGPASDFEGSGSAPALDATTAAVRAGAGCVDTDANDADFSAAPPAPRNAATAAVDCGGGSAASAAAQNASVRLDLQPVLSLALDRASLAFGQVAPGSTPAPLAENATVTSTSASGYALSVHRTAFAPADLPLALAATAPSGATLGSGLAGGAFVPIPIAPLSDLVVGTSSAPSAGTGDVWPTSLGFAAPLPSLAPGSYTATVTFTVVGR